MLAHNFYYPKSEKPGELWAPMWERKRSKAARLALLRGVASAMYGAGRVGARKLIGLTHVRSRKFHFISSTFLFCRVASRAVSRMSWSPFPP